MEEAKQVGQSYAEFLKDVRAKQFGWQTEEVTEITENTSVKATTAKKTSTKNTKEDKKDNE